MGLKNDLKKVGGAVKKAAKTVGKDVNKGAKKAGKAVKNAAKAVEKAHDDPENTLANAPPIKPVNPSAKQIVPPAARPSKRRSVWAT